MLPLVVIYFRTESEDGALGWLNEPCLRLATRWSSLEDKKQEVEERSAEKGTPSVLPR